MNEDKGVMKYEATLPENFDGTFWFTNPTDEEFVGIWGKKEYHFAPQTTSKMIMPEYTPLEVQHIRKKFAKDLAEREFYKSDKYREFLKVERNPDGTPRANGIQMAATYTLGDLTPFIQKCLEPLEISQVAITEAAIPSVEDKLTRNDDGELNTEAIDQKKSLRKKALEA
jgi:hypothetical protein